MGNIKDLTGMRFGKLTAIKYELSPIKRLHWVCKCDCGNTTLVEGGNLRCGHTRSCGCLHKESITTHGMNKTPTYWSWFGMKQRCTNSNSIQFDDYGGRGITLCDSWLTFDGFFTDMGIRPDGMSIDRIDNNKGYSKENCRWATTTEQANNKRSTVIVTYDGNKYSVRQLSEIIGVHYLRIWRAVKKYGDNWKEHFKFNGVAP